MHAVRREQNYNKDKERIAMTAVVNDAEQFVLFQRSVVRESLLLSSKKRRHAN
ncbi:hypothetical protein BH18ACI4_BH18ACI4_14700 [soil metagenome]